MARVRLVEYAGAPPQVGSVCDDVMKARGVEVDAQFRG